MKKETNSNLQQLTPRLLIASLSKPTTLFPSAPDALKPLVQLSRIPCGKKDFEYLNCINDGYRRQGVKETLFLGGKCDGSYCITWSITPYLVNVLMSYRKGEGETQRKLFVLDMMFVQKVWHTLCYVVKQLQRERNRGCEMWTNVVLILFWEIWSQRCCCCAYKSFRKLLATLLVLSCHHHFLFLIMKLIRNFYFNTEVTNHFSSACHGIFRNGVHLVLGLHLPAPLLIFTHLHQHHTEVRPPQVQSQEVAHLCQNTHYIWVHILALSPWWRLCDLYWNKRKKRWCDWRLYLIPQGWSRHTLEAFWHWLLHASLNAVLSPSHAASSSWLLWALPYSAWTLTGSALPAMRGETSRSGDGTME